MLFFVDSGDPKDLSAIPIPSTIPNAVYKRKHPFNLALSLNYLIIHEVVYASTIFVRGGRVIRPAK
jgi:hypothetical protein